MIAYFVNKRVLSRRFEKDGDEYVYRRRPDLLGYRVSDKQRRETLREFRARYWKAQLLIFAGVLAGLVALFVISEALELGEGFEAFTTFIFVIGLVVAIFWQQRRTFNLPERRFSDCPSVESKVPAGNWLARFKRLSRERSWPKHGTMIALFGFLGWAIYPHSADAAYGPWIMFVSFAGCLILTVAGAIHKAVSSAE